MSEFQEDVDNRLVILGHVSGVYGVKGWLKIHSETDPVQNVLKYKPWFVSVNNKWQQLLPVQGKKHGKGVIVQLEGFADRDQAAELKGSTIAVKREQLPDAASNGQYYWTDLEGLDVRTTDGFELGRLSHLFETGSNDVMVVEGDRQRLIPYIVEQVVREIDLENGTMTVDWDKDF